jgi:ATP-binding cassette subfamily B protein
VVVEEGNHDQLMALEAAYWRLYQAQQRQAEAEGAVLGGVVQEEVKA